jgi:hypothetical protein
MATKPLAVKVKTEKVITALKKALADRKQKIADHEKAVKAHEQSVKEWKEKVTEALREGKGKVSEVTHNRYRWDSDKKSITVQFTVEFPLTFAEPKEPEQKFREWELNNDLEELENAIALLSMTEEEYINASTYKGVARFIK